ncbi:hypothetical protein S40288_11133 [Stachybotrys chartarum IBT 40288]|nr:hypothetical protein S40288_11133 [Stachybotrys chartarum IBT 40288]
MLLLPFGHVPARTIVIRIYPHRDTSRGWEFCCTNRQQLLDNPPERVSTHRTTLRDIERELGLDNVPLSYSQDLVVVTGYKEGYRAWIGIQTKPELPNTLVPFLNSFRFLALPGWEVDYFLADFWMQDRPWSPDPWYNLEERRRWRQLNPTYQDRLMKQPIPVAMDRRRYTVVLPDFRDGAMLQGPIELFHCHDERFIEIGDPDLTLDWMEYYGNANNAAKARGQRIRKLVDAEKDHNLLDNFKEQEADDEDNDADVDSDIYGYEDDEGDYEYDGEDEYSEEGHEEN